MDYLLGENTFELTSAENKKIINEKVLLEINKQRGKKISNLPNNSNFYDAPLFVILFILARLSEQQIKFSDTKDALSIYKSIINDDLRKIYAINPSLVLTLYIWANVYKEQPFYIPLKTLGRLVDHYSEKYDLPQNNADFKIKRVVKILERYTFGFELTRYDYKDFFIWDFNHPLLAEKFAEPYDIDWHFNERDFFNVLVSFGELSIARDLYEIYRWDDADTITINHSAISGDFTYQQMVISIPSLRDHIYTNRLLEQCYESASIIEREDIWEEGLFIMSRLLRYQDDIDEFLKFVNNLIICGCKAKCVLDAHEKGVNSPLLLVQEYSQKSMKDFQYFIRQP
jgi:hypothetical protein